jgi:hypothetical protein
MTIESAIDSVRHELQSSGMEIREGVTFDWLTNRAPHENEPPLPPRIMYRLIALHSRLGGDWLKLEKKRKRLLSYHFLVNEEVLIEVDRYFHFSSARLETLGFYEPLNHSLDIRRYRKLCEQFAERADRYQQRREAPDFAFEGGRTAQRAYFDTVKDLLAPAYGYRVVRLPAATDEQTENISLTLRVLL